MSGPRTGEAVTEWRRRTKARLVEYHGSECLDCGYQGPPFMFDFDHRDPHEKSFGITGKTKAYEALRIESLKCDLLCANCHRWRTHLQRCSGCEYCTPTGSSVNRQTNGLLIRDSWFESR